MKLPHLLNKTGPCSCCHTWEPHTKCANCKRMLTTAMNHNNWRVYTDNNVTPSTQVHLCGDCIDEYITMRMLAT